MSLSPKTRVVSASAFLGVAIAFAWVSFQAAQRKAAAAAGLSLTLGQVAADLQRAQDRVAAQTRDQAALQTKLAAAPSRSPAAGRPGAPDAATLMAADPELRDLYLKSFRAGMRIRYGAIYQLLGLTPAQIDKFEELATAREGDKNTINAAAVAHGFAPNDPGIAELQRQSTEQFNASVASALGPGIAQQLDQIHRLQPVDNYVAAAGAMIASNATPLTPTQNAQLVQLMANASPSYQGGGEFSPMSVDWKKLETQAATILSPAQAQVFNSNAQLYELMGVVQAFYAGQAPAN